jgi:sec-independent protein translocase protein TatC
MIPLIRISQNISGVAVIDSKEWTLSSETVNNGALSSPIRFIFTNITEAFQTSISLSFFISLFLILPLIVYHIWGFCLPSLYNFERKNFTNDCIFFLFFFIIATVLSVTLIFPFFWKFFLKFEEINLLYELECEPRISSYISFLFYIIISTHFFCEIPFIFFLLLKYNYLDILSIIKKRRIIYLSLLLFISILSPPEIMTQIFLFVICLIFFELCVFLKIIMGE